MQTRSSLLYVVAAVAIAALALSCQRGDLADSSTEATKPADAATMAGQANQQVNQLADQYYERALERQPELAYFVGIEIDRHDRLSDYSPDAIARSQREDDAMLAALAQIDRGVLIGTPEWVTYGVMVETLEADRRARVCRSELWSVNQMSGWQLALAQVAQYQPVGTPDLRKQALSRWRSLPSFIDQQIANLEQGLTLGYSSPKPVVERVLDQMDGVLALPIKESPFYSPAERDDDEAFATALGAVLSEEITPALQRYRDFLADTYLGQARDELSVTANPDGRACYDAMLRSYTTLDRSPEEVFELGKRTVAANRARVIELGEATYDLDEFSAIVERVKSDPTDRFKSKEQLLEYSREMVSAAGEAMPDWVGRMPSENVVVEPFPEYQDGTGVFNSYEAGSKDRPGTYRISLHNPHEQSIGRSELVALHEAWPGHHLQISLAQEVQGLHRIMDIVSFTGFIEGWARYSEALAEEMGLYRSATGPILRRTWPARGMVADPGLHIMGWSRQQVLDFLNESGTLTPTEVEDMVDRIAIIPGQLTAYDSGGLEIFALRAQAEEQLGDAFDLRVFHDRILENGNVPLEMLRAHIEAWLAEEVGTGEGG